MMMDGAGERTGICVCARKFVCACPFGSGRGQERVCVRGEREKKKDMRGRRLNTELHGVVLL